MPASGKSTWAKTFVRENDGWQRINRDEIRWMLDADTFKSNSGNIVNIIQEQAIRTLLSEDMNIIVDNTHLESHVVKSLHKIAEDVGDVEVTEKCFDVTVEVCMRRNALRTGVARVPDSVMQHFVGRVKKIKFEDKVRYYPPKHSGVTLYEPYGDHPKAVICDLDGTLALLNGRDPYNASDCDKDLPNKAVVECLRCMYLNNRTILFVSGREAKYAEKTLTFLQEHCDFIFSSSVPRFELMMRQTGDFRKDTIVKYEIFNTHIRNCYNVEFVLDDRNSVVEMWRTLGIPTFQVNYGDF